MALSVEMGLARSECTDPRPGRPRQWPRTSVGLIGHVFPTLSSLSRQAPERPQTRYLETLIAAGVGKEGAHRKRDR